MMVEKYGWNERESAALCAFMLPMLRIDHRKRASAGEMLRHEWLEVGEEEMGRVGSW